jgi:outer membrane protein OmpA-like peptidoglycan-associated protein/uncharacterized protein YidB (DUF937 family)
MLMGALDTVVHDVGSQLGIGTSSMGSVLSGLLSFIDSQEGGISAFLDRFKRAGVGNIVTSWLSGDTRPVTADTVENVMGHDAISGIASRAGIPFTAAASAIAMMLPKLIQRLAPGGAIPTRLSPELASYISGPAAAVSSGARQVAAYSRDTVARAPGIGRYLWPILALLLVGGLLYWFLQRGTTTDVGRVAFNIQDQVLSAAQRATSALSALKPGFTGPQLVGALNLGVINFATGSAQIPADSYDYLNRAAAAIKLAPAGLAIEVGGHTDNAGNSAANMQLSQQRADAVRSYLIQQGVSGSVLTARGYGDTRPVASNTTDEGRFRNRRIEFSVS